MRRRLLGQRGSQAAGSAPGGGCGSSSSCLLWAGVSCCSSSGQSLQEHRKTEARGGCGISRKRGLREQLDLLADGRCVQEQLVTVAAGTA